jgi:hypothetical protein
VLCPVQGGRTEVIFDDPFSQPCMKGFAPE